MPISEPRPDQTSPATVPLHETPLWNNFISLTGLFIVMASIILMLTFGLFSVVSPSPNPYVDIVGYLVLPGILVTGLLITPIGIMLRLRKVHRTQPGRKFKFGWPRIDLADPRLRRAMTIFLALTLLMLPVLGVSGYHGYHFTESSQFCGKTCHSVMEPQYSAYELSPHARVSCAECHIGSGAGWFVKSKLSGVRQVFAVWFDTYSKPIPPAITDLRPARDTCEECHWPEKFFGSQSVSRVHFSPDEQNTRREVRMMLKTGGADELIGRAEGIHWHMALDATIEYVAVDEGLQDIPWVRHTDRQGRVVVYRSDRRSGAEPPPTGIVRTVDCMDCHNRAAHLFHPPYKSVDYYLDTGRIDPALPFIKREAVTLLTASYADKAQARERIRTGLEAFYAKEYPQVLQQQRQAVDKASGLIAEIYDHTFFPDMKVDWRSYPDNVGHMYSSGCFRCHDGRHVSDDGQQISSDCDACHTFLNRVEGTENAFTEGSFAHSMNLFPHPTLRCEQCHTGGHLPLCRECHESGEWLEQKGKEGFEPKPPGS